VLTNSQLRAADRGIRLFSYCFK